MEKISFDYVIPKKGVLYDISNSEKITYIGIIGLLLVFVITASYDKLYEVNLLKYWTFKLICLGCIICLLIGVFKGFGDSDGNNLDIGGIIFLDANEITIDYVEIYPIEKITHIKFSGHDVKGAINTFSGTGEPSKSLGAENYLEFKYEQKAYNYQFIVRSQQQRELLVEKVIPQLRKHTRVIIT
ncbi:MAG: hypothetical protein AB8B65_04975 [Kordia sp.]|uniref:hypothetical protein n=1 Tax=Kordia sp. TaxID=1965332 RepID=UPI00385AF914